VDRLIALDNATLARMRINPATFNHRGFR
jgi:hypothetical protein